MWQNSEFEQQGQVYTSQNETAINEDQLGISTQYITWQLKKYPITNKACL